MKNKENNRMQADIDLSNVVETAEYINVYESGEMTTYSNREKPFEVIVEGWKNMLQGSHEMPAFGVSLNRETTKALKDGTWVEFVFETQNYYNEVPFEKLLVNVEKSFQGFNIIRYNANGGYDGRCYYVDLVNKNMTDFYNIIVNL